MRPGEGWDVAPEDDPVARKVEMDITIEGNSDGCLLYVMSADRSVWGDAFFDTLEKAEEEAREVYGVTGWEEEEAYEREPSTSGVAARDEPNSSWSIEAKSRLERGNKLEAIKLVVEMTDLTLLEAKQLVDLWDEEGV